MSYPIYSFRDTAAGRFGQPILEANEMTAVRGFKMAINSQQGTMNFAPQDFDLYKIGEFDIEKGELIPELPCLVMTGVQAVVEIK